MEADKKPPEAPWAECVADEKWPVYRELIEHAKQRAKKEGWTFALGGAFAVATFTGRWRGTKDIDFYVLPERRQEMIDVLGQVGLEDYYHEKPYDRSWIYRGYSDQIIADVIWAMPNRRSEVTAEWLDRSLEISLLGEKLKVISAEEIIWSKLYVLQHDRSDWPDLLNILYASGEKLDWDHLIKLLDEEIPLLGGLMSVFAWLAPNRAASFPGWVWNLIDLQAPQPVEQPEEVMRARAYLLDTRAWFYPVSDVDE